MTFAHDQVGRLWQALAGYFIRLGQFEKARDVYDEAIQAVVTVRDFSIVFDAYVLFEESMLTAKINLRKDIDEEAAQGKGTTPQHPVCVRLCCARMTRACRHCCCFPGPYFVLCECTCPTVLHCSRQFL